MMPDFPQGPGFTQERFIAAFNGLTKMLVASTREHSELRYVNGNPGYWRDRWEEMFNTLIEEQEHAREEDVD